MSSHNHWYSPGRSVLMSYETDTPSSKKAEPEHTHATPKASIGVRQEEQVDTIVAYKYGSFVVKGDMLLLSGAHRYEGYGVEAVATCAERSNYHYGFAQTPRPACDPKAVPGEQCECGFYAYDTLEGDGRQKYDGGLILEVELYGKVVVHERGMRSSHQRVLSVTVPRCDYTLCDEASRAAILWHDPEDGSFGQFRYRCDDHKHLHNSSSSTLTLSELAGMVGTEVKSA